LLRHSAVEKMAEDGVTSKPYSGAINREKFREFQRTKHDEGPLRLL